MDKYPRLSDVPPYLRTLPRFVSPAMRRWRKRHEAKQ